MLERSTLWPFRLTKKLLPIGAALAVFAVVGCGGGDKEETGSGNDDFSLLSSDPSDQVLPVGTLGDQCLSGNVIGKNVEAPDGDGIEFEILGKCPKECKFDPAKAHDGLGGNAQDGAECL